MFSRNGEGKIQVTPKGQSEQCVGAWMAALRVPSW